jgi:hypothetical protein
MTPGQGQQTMNDRDHLEAVCVELRDTELDTVCGGFFNFRNVLAQVSQAAQNATAVGGFIGSHAGAAVMQVLSQANVSAIA